MAFVLRQFLSAAQMHVRYQSDKLCWRAIKLAAVDPYPWSPPKQTFKMSTSKLIKTAYPQGIDNQF